MGALTKFDISGNYLRAEGGMALAAGLEGNQVITELNISSNALCFNSNERADSSGVDAIVDAIPDMGAMTSLNLADNMICGINKYGNGTYDASGKWPLASLVTAAAVTPVQPCVGIIALANAIPDMGALITLDISSNLIGAEHKGGLQRICVASGIDFAM
jgi:hypothetical protein